ncbi:hypothetical protein V6N13_038120 [Hibiscus sabdariffa]|uniref:Uncharacterized protein n=1 Tax=Hibiscus sabdariffa TaxID=183260 RepID=A0ABR2S3Y7_9ROSI
MPPLSLGNTLTQRQNPRNSSLRPALPMLSFTLIATNILLFSSSMTQAENNQLCLPSLLSRPQALLNLLTTRLRSHCNLMRLRH